MQVIHRQDKTTKVDGRRQGLYARIIIHASRQFLSALLNQLPVPLQLQQTRLRNSLLYGTFKKLTCLVHNVRDHITVLAEAIQYQW